MNFVKGQTIYRQGDPADALYIITSGHVSLVAKSLGSSTELARMGPGQIIGDLGLFFGSPRTSDAVALSDVQVQCIKYEDARKQFAAQPQWIQSMTRTLALQVQSFSTEIKPLRDHDDSGAMSRLVIARAWAALTLISHQFGEREKKSISIDWPTLRSFSNLCFREISARVLELAKALQAYGYTTVHSDVTGPTKIELIYPDVFMEFLNFYTRSIIRNSPELGGVKPIEYATLQVLANPSLNSTPIHRGQVEVSLSEFTNLAKRMGHPEINATAVDLLKVYNVDVSKISAEDGVRLRFQKEDVALRIQFWLFIKIIHEMNTPTKAKSA